MAKINRAKEFVEAHSTEEILEWLDSGLKRLVIAMNQYEGGKDGFILGQVGVNIVEAQLVTAALKEKLTPKPPVVA